MNDITNKINKFKYTVINSFKDIDLSNFYNNIDNLRVIVTTDEIFGKLDYYTSSNYDYLKNIIFLKKESIIDNSFYHELFHMASNNSFDKDNLCVGFYSFRNHHNIGKGINEGYTELLKRRYFGKESKNYIYEFEVIIAKCLEEIIGKNKMESLYLRADLSGLINILKEYCFDDVLSFIKDVDYVSDYIYNEDMHDEILERVNKINNFIISCRLNKIGNVKDNKYPDIYKINYIESLNEFNLIQENNNDLRK